MSKRHWYNGLIVALPDYDSTRYPYARLAKDGEFYIFSATDERPFYNGEMLEFRNDYEMLTYTFSAGEDISAIEMDVVHRFADTEPLLPFWTNFDILDEEDNVYSQGSQPVLATTRYSYNGYKFPALPEYDPCIYSYAYFRYNEDNNTAGLTLTSEKFTSYVVSATGKTWVHTPVFAYPDSVSVARYTSSIGDTAWTLESESKPQELSGIGLPDWSNADILDDTSNAITLEATDPEPVFFDLKSWLFGFALGVTGKKWIGFKGEEGASLR